LIPAGLLVIVPVPVTATVKRTLLPPLDVPPQPARTTAQARETAKAGNRQVNECRP
jgi:hypothetical protein